MSFTYKMVENVCFFLNKHANGLIKEQMYQRFLYPKEISSLPGYMYQKFAISKVKHRGATVFIICNCDVKKRNNKAVLFLAGGGGLLGPMGIHFDTAKRLVEQSNVTLYFAFYPLAPKYNVKDALQWLENVYVSMCKRFQPEEICFVGDSAGANLALSLAYRANKKPGKVIAISPAPGLEDGKKRNIRKAMEEQDPLLNVKMNDLIAKFWAKNVPLDSPDINPAHIDYHNFSKVMLLYGTHEVFYPHVLTMIAKMEQEHADVTCLEKEMCHDWALCSFFPEGKEAIDKMVSYILDI